MGNNVFFFLKYKNDVRFFYDTLTLEEGLKLMKEHGFTAVPVINIKGEYLGSVSEGDFLWFILKNGQDENTLKTTLIGDLLREDFMPAVSIDLPVEELFNRSLHQNYVPVVDDRNIFIGIVTRQKILDTLLQNMAALPDLEGLVSSQTAQGQHLRP